MDLTMLKRIKSMFLFPLSLNPVFPFLKKLKMVTLNANI